jgi:hypothetical protein
MSEELASRGDWAEEYVRGFLSLPLISEFVFHSVQTNDVTQKEVADFLIHYPGVGILISQKTQHDPFSRDTAKNTSWVLKKNCDAASQLRGPLREPKRPMWCKHPQRGRVDLPEGLPSITHGLVLVETFKAVDLNPQAADLPLEYKGAAITYLSLNDFLHVAKELRTGPEILAYLDARRSLPYIDLRTIGDERALLEFYFLQGGSLAGCVGKADAAIVVAARQAELDQALRAKCNTISTATSLNTWPRSSRHVGKITLRAFRRKTLRDTTIPTTAKDTSHYKQSSPICTCASERKLGKPFPKPWRNARLLRPRLCTKRLMWILDLSGFTSWARVLVSIRKSWKIESTKCG